MNLRPVTLSDKQLFDTYTKAFPLEISESTFTNCFCWQTIKDVQFTEEENHLLIQFTDDDGARKWLAPLGAEPEKIMQKFIEQGEIFSRVPESIANKISFPCEKTYDRDNSDYIYDLNKIRTMEGRKLDGKRNYIKRFSEYDPSTIQLTKSMSSECLAVHEKWLEKHTENVSIQKEAIALKTAINNCDKLTIEGIGLRVGGKLVAFAIGEALNSTTFVDHFEKALPGFTGVYQYLHHELAKYIPDQYTLINREQDLGEENLRKAKESWNPLYLVKKYEIKA